MSKTSSAGVSKKPAPKKQVGFGAAPSVSKFKRTGGITGEDLPALKKIAKELKGQNLTVEDYILLVGPHTGDKGAALTKVMNEDLTSFRRMVTKVYDTMTKDASDVMANTQIELGQLYSEKQRILVDNMIRSLQTIKDYVPYFDFQQYFQDPDKYLSSLFKLADIPDDEEIEAARRQLAYHRLQWLQSEGERLQAENIKLEERLGELKKVKRKQITEALSKEQEAERKREELEQKQEEMQNELEELCDELHDAIITEEKKTMDTKKEKKVKILAKKPKRAVAGKGQGEKEDWNVKVAVEYSKAQLQGEATVNRPAAGISETDASSAKTASKTRLKKKGRKPVPIHSRPSWQDVNVDEFNVGSAASEDQVPVDIFSSAYRATAAPRACPPSCTSASSQGRAASPGPRGRRSAGPRDTWGGFR